VAVHCKAGKGRTGLVICCFMLYTEMFETVEESMEHYNSTRVNNKKGLTIPSQIRQVFHFKQFLDTHCVGRGRNVGGKKHYVYNSIYSFSTIMNELDKMELG